MLNKILFLASSKSLIVEVIIPGTPGGDGINLEAIEVAIFAIYNVLINSF